MRSEQTTSWDLQLPALPLGNGRGRRLGLERSLREAIRGGRLRSGTRLPSTRALAADLGLSRGTVVAAYEQLNAEGYLSSRAGSGTVVAQGFPGDGSSGGTGLGAEPPSGRRTASFDFRFGVPDPSSFPRAAWARALRSALRELPEAELGPGEARGAPALRSALESYLARARGVVAPSGSALVCTGFIQGLRLLCEAIRAEGGGAVAIEDPCLPDHRAVIAAAGLRPVPLAVDERGADPAALSCLEVDAVVLTPAHQALLGGTLPPERRQAFVQWAQRPGRWLIEDDYDGEFRHRSQPIGALQGLEPARVAYAGSASKSLAPILRLGWVLAPAALGGRVVEAKRRADRGSELLGQLALARMLDSGEFDRHVRRMRSRYRGRREQLLALLASTDPALLPAGEPSGLHLTVPLQEVGQERRLIAEARRRRIALAPLSAYYERRGAARPGLVIGYGAPPEHAWGASLNALGQLLAAELG